MALAGDHRGNIQPTLDLEEHEGLLNAKRVSLVSSATTFVSAGFSGNVTLNPSPNFIGLMSVAQPLNANVSLSAGAAFIGLTTTTLGLGNRYIGLVTSTPVGLTTIVSSFLNTYTTLSTVISATGPATLVVPPSGEKVFVRNMFVSSLGRSEISSWAVNSSTTTNRIPWTGLATTGGFVYFGGEEGEQWGIADQGLTFALNAAATVGVKVNVRFSA